MAVLQSVEEQRIGISKMQNHLKEHNVSRWVRGFMQKLVSGFIKV
jgi:trehalose-6-phosphate synthase